MGGKGFLGKWQNSTFGANEENADLSKLSRAYYESSKIQRFLPPALRQPTTGPILQAGVGGIGDLIRNPGGLSPTVSDAIRPQLAEESQSIAQNFRNMESSQAGAAARGNAPVSIKNALSSALDIAQERAQRTARNEALTSSEQLRRGDMEQVYKLLDMINQFISSGRGVATQGLAAASTTKEQQIASNMELAGKLASMGGGMGG